MLRGGSYAIVQSVFCEGLALANTRITNYVSNPGNPKEIICPSEEESNKLP